VRRAAVWRALIHFNREGLIMRITTAATWAIGGLALVIGAATARGDGDMYSGRVEFVGVACFSGKPVGSGEVVEESGMRYTILRSWAQVVLDQDAGRATGFIEREIAYEAGGGEVRRLERHEIDGEFDVRDPGPGRPADAKWYRMSLKADHHMRSGETRTIAPGRVYLFGLRFRDPTLTVPGQPQLAGDFILFWEQQTKDGHVGVSGEMLAESLPQGELEYPMAVVWRGRIPADEDGGDVAAVDPPSDGVIGDPLDPPWEPTRIKGRVEVRVPGGAWRALTSEMRIGQNVEIRTGGDGLLEMTITRKGQGGRKYTDATTQLGPNGFLELKPKKDGFALHPLLMHGILTWSAQDAGRVSVSTPTARIEPDGTAFDVAYDARAARTAVQVDEGAVRVTPRHPGLPPKSLAVGQTASIGTREMTVEKGGEPQSYHTEAEPPAEMQAMVDRSTALASSIEARGAGEAEAPGGMAWVWIVLAVLVAAAVVGAAIAHRSRAPGGAA